MPHPSTTPLEIAREQLLSAAAGWSPQQEICGVSNALGRVLATEQISSVDLPQTDNVAVDGYAVEAAFLAAHPDHLFKVAGTARAGHPLCRHSRARRGCACFYRGSYARRVRLCDYA